MVLGKEKVMNRRKVLIAVAAVLVMMFAAVAFAACDKGGCKHLTLEHHPQIQATCTQDGSIDYWECVDCGKYFSDEGAQNEVAKENIIVKAGHSLYYVQEQEAVCGETGNSAYWKCSECGKIFRDSQGSIELTEEDTSVAGEHLWSEWETLDDIHMRECGLCGEIVYGDHTYDSEGVCTVCGYKEGETTTHVHDLIHFERVEANCYNNGNIEYWYCKTCNRYYSDAEAKFCIDKEDIYIEASHLFSEEWKRDEIYHWHETICEHQYIADKGEHVLVDGLCTICSARPQGTTGLEYQLNQYGTGYVVVGIGDSVDSDIIIPSSYNGKPVTEIEGNFIEGKNFVESVTIPVSVKYINGAFYGASSLNAIKIDDLYSWCKISFGASYNNPLYNAGNLYYKDELVTELVIPEGIEMIGAVQFGGCTSITSVTIPEGVTSISWDAFRDCTSLKEVIFPESLVSIDSCAFDGCTQLEEITFPGGIEEIDEKAFWNCVNIKNINVSENNEKFKSINGNLYSKDGSVLYAYAPAKEDTTVVISANVKEIYSRAFASAKNIEEVIFEEGSLIKKIGDYAFYNCENLEKIILPEGVTKIGNNAFCYCAALTAINIPQSVRKVGSYAYSACSSLKSIFIPSGVETVGHYAFNNRDAVIYCDDDEKPVGWDDNWTICANMWGYTYVEDDGLMYGIKDGHADFLVQVGNNLEDIVVKSSIEFEGTVYPVTGIVASAFNLCHELLSVIIPDSVSSVGSYCVSSQANVYCEQGSASAGWASDWVTPYAQVVWGYDGYIKENGVVYGLKNGSATVVRQSVRICGDITVKSEVEYDGVAYKVDTIDDEAFMDSREVVSMTLPDLDYIGERAFYNSAVEKIILLGGLGYVSEGAFNYLPYLQIVDVYDISGLCETTFFTQYNNPVVSADNVYLNGEIATQVVIPYGTTKIGDYALYGFKDMENIIIPDTVKSIGEFALAECDSLVSLRIPNGVTTLGNYMTYGCDNIKYIIIPSSVVSIEGQSLLTDSDQTLYFEAESCPEGWTLPNKYICVWGYEYVELDGIVYGVKDRTASVIRQSASLSGEVKIRNTVGLSGEDYYVRNIEEDAFSMGEDIIELYIPESVTYIAIGALDYCVNLSHIEVDNNNTSYLALHSILLSKDGSILYKYAPGIKDWSYNLSNIGVNVERIEEKAFLGSLYLQQLTIPSTVKEIGNYAFSSSKSLKKVVLSEGLEKIGNNAFWYCENLEDITLPNSLYQLGDYAFGSCDSLKMLIIPERLTEIGKNISYNSDDLKIYSEKSSSGGVSVAEYGYKYVIYDGLIYGVKNDKAYLLQQFDVSGEVVIPSSISYNGQSFEVVAISNYAFEYFDVTKVTIPDTVTEIGQRVFYYCNELKSIDIPSSVSSIGIECFYITDSLQAINVDEENQYFKSVDGVLFSKDGTILYAYPQKKAYVEEVRLDGVVQIETYAFYGNDNFDFLTIPIETVNVGNMAITYCDPVVIRCEAESLPEGWGSNWLVGDNAVIFGWDSNETTEDGTLYFMYDGLMYGLKDGEAFVAVQKEYISGDIEIPSAVQFNGVSYNVTGIGDKAFFGCENITGIVLPEGIKTIGRSAFYSCISIKEIVLPNSLTTIEAYAFRDCDRVESWYIPATVTTIEEYAFDCWIPMIIYCEAESKPDGWDEFWTNDNSFVTWGCGESTEQDGMKYVFVDSIRYGVSNGVAFVAKQLQSFSESVNIAHEIICDGVTYEVQYIEDSAFNYCSKITSVIISASLKYIGASAFNQCSNLQRIQFVNDGTVEEIRNYAFANCYDIITLNLPEGVKTIGENAFFNCSSLRYVYMHTADLKTLGQDAFIGCDSLYSVDIDDLATWCGITFENSFANPLSNGACLSIMNEDLTDLIIPDGVERIEAYAFCNLGNIDKLVIPASVKYVGTDAFAGIKEIGSVHISDIGAWCSFDFSSYGSNPLQYAGELYVNDELLTELVLTEEVPYVGEMTFINYDLLVSVTIPANTKVAGSAFIGCVNIEKATAPVSAFKEMPKEKLEQITINFGSAIEDNLFYFASNLLKVDIVGDISYIGEYAFANCSDLQIVRMSDSVETIGDYAFAECINLKIFDFSEGLKRLGDGVFQNCVYLSSVTLPYGLFKIGEEAFAGCINIVEINYFASDVEDLPSDADVFENAGRGNEGIALLIGANVARIPAYLFAVNNTSLVANIRYVTFEQSSLLATVGEGAFFNCCLIDTLSVPDIATWLRMSFDDVYASPMYYTNRIIVDGEVLNYLYIPEEVTRIGSYAFYNCNDLIEVYIHDSVEVVGAYAFGDASDVTVFCGSEALPEGWDINWTGYPVVWNWDTDCIADNGYIYTIKNGVRYGIKDGKAIVAKQPFALPNENITIMSTIEYRGETYPVTAIGNGAFNNNYKIKNVVIEEGIQTIEDYAFNNCTGLVSITLPSSVTSIGREAFSFSYSIENLYISDIASFCEINIDHNGAPFYGSDAETKLYLNGELVTDIVIPEGVRVVSNFYKIKSIKKVTLPSTVITLRETAFAGCSSLTEIILNDGLKNIYEYAFSECESLVKVTIPSSVTTIDIYAFINCLSLEEIIFEDVNGWEVAPIGENPTITQIEANDLKDPVIAKNYLTDQYLAYIWTHNEV